MKSQELHYKVDYLMFRKIETYIMYRDQIRSLRSQIDNLKEIVNQPTEQEFKKAFKEKAEKILDDRIFDLKMFERKIKLIEKELLEAGIQFTQPDGYLEPMPF